MMCKLKFLYLIIYDIQEVFYYVGSFFLRINLSHEATRIMEPMRNPNLIIGDDLLVGGNLIKPNKQRYSVADWMHSKSL